MFKTRRNDDMATKTIEGPSREAVRALLERGGPFTPGEFAMLGLADPVERLALRHRTVSPSLDAEAAEDRRRVEEKFGARRAAAEADLAAAIAAREAAVEALFVGRDAQQAVKSTTWITGGGDGGMYERGGTAAQLEAAQGRLEDAERDMKQARQTEEAAREKLSAIGVAANAMRRELGAARAQTGKK